MRLFSLGYFSSRDSWRGRIIAYILTRCLVVQFFLCICLYLYPSVRGFLFSLSQSVVLWGDEWENPLVQVGMIPTTLLVAYSSLRNGTLRNETKSVLCEMKICTLRNENLYFAKRKSVLCEMKISTLRSENLYFADLMHL